MSESHPTSGSGGTSARRDAAPSVEDQLILDWSALGILRLERHLRLHAEFRRYLEARDRAADHEEKA